jgi:hypothetical protein
MLNKIVFFLKKKIENPPLTFALRCVGAHQRLSLYGKMLTWLKRRRGGKSHAAKNAETKQHERLCLLLGNAPMGCSAPLEPPEKLIFIHYSALPILTQ